MFTVYLKIFCEENNMSVLSDEEQAPLQNVFNINIKESVRIDEDTLANALNTLALKYDCLFIDEILLESYHSD